MSKRIFMSYLFLVLTTIIIASFCLDINNILYTLKSLDAFTFVIPTSYVIVFFVILSYIFELSSLIRLLKSKISLWIHIPVVYYHNQDTILLKPSIILKSTSLVKIQVMRC